MNSSTKYWQQVPVGKRPWFLVLRLVIPFLLLASGLAFLRPIAFNYTLLVIYGALGFLFFVYTFVARSYSEDFIRGLLIALISCELLIEGLLVNHVGGNSSPFILFFITTIVTASLFFHLAGSIVVATLAGLLYSLPIFLDLSFVYEGLIGPARLAGKGISSDEAFYTVFLHLCLFYICAFISGYLAENLFHASRELSKIRLEIGEILEKMNSGLLTVDAGGDIIYFNKAAVDILGIDPLEMRNKTFPKAFHSGLREFTSRIGFAIKSGRSDARAEISIRHPQKGLVPVGLSLSVLKDDERKVRGVIAVFQDLTEAKKFESHMRAIDRLAAVGQLAAGIAHEIRNPLASISGSVEVLKDELKPEGDNLRLLQLILKESSRLNTILNDFLNFARVTKISSGECDLSSVISEVMELASTHCQVNGLVEISCKIHDSKIMILGGEDQLKQVLWNLVLNSAQALGDRGGKIRISTEDYIDDSRGEMVKLVVADNGPGIPDDIREKVFQPFFSTRQDGTGLGLPIVARIVDCLGGVIEIESSNDWGTMITILLPRGSVSLSKHEVLQEVNDE